MKKDGINPNINNLSQFHPFFLVKSHFEKISILKKFIP